MHVSDLQPTGQGHLFHEAWLDQARGCRRLPRADDPESEMIENAKDLIDEAGLTMIGYILRSESIILSGSGRNIQDRNLILLTALLCPQCTDDNIMLEYLLLDVQDPVHITFSLIQLLPHPMPV